MAAVSTLPDPQSVWPDHIGIDGAGFHGQTAVDIAAAMWPANPTALPAIGSGVNYPGDKLTKQRWKRSPDHDGQETPAPGRVDMALTMRRRSSLVIAPGLITVRVATGDDSDPTPEIHDHDCLCPVCNDPEADMTVEDIGIVRSFSDRARGRMMRYVASVDWTDIQDDERLVMLTWTYPNEWRDAAPTPEQTQVHLDKMCKRYYRATGRKLKCVWVREFQRRGAPHFHLLAIVVNHVDTETFQQWQSRNWYQAVASGDPKHLLAGTGYHIDDTLRSVDPKRLAAYFAGYTSKDKAYQTEPPADWANDNGSVGAFWGRRALATATAEVAITDDDIIEIRRTMRRFFRAQKRTATRTVGRTWQVVYAPVHDVYTQDQVDRMRDRTGLTQIRLPADVHQPTAQGARDRGWINTDVPLIDSDQLATLGPSLRRKFTPIVIATTRRKANRRWNLKALTPAGPNSDTQRGFSVFVNNGPGLAIKLAQHLHTQPPPWPKGQPRPLP